MACLDNYILVRGSCNGATPSTGLYIDDLPGITLSKAAHTTEDFSRGSDLLLRCVDQAIVRVREKLVSELLGTVLFNQTLSTGVYGKFADYINDSTKYLPVTPVNRGLRFELDECCRINQIHVKRVRILVNSTVTNGTLTITDGVTANTYTFSAVPMVPVYVETNFNAHTDLVEITLDNASISVNNSTLSYTGTCGFCDNDCTGQPGCKCNAGLSIWGWDGTQKTGHTYGLSAVVHTVCSEERFFCEISNLGSIPLSVWYESGIVFLEHLINTQRTNVYTNYSQDDAKIIREDWMAMVDEKITKIVKQLPKYLMQVCPDCLECNSSRWEHQMP